MLQRESHTQTLDTVFQYNPRIRQIAFVCVQKIFSTRYNTHARRLSDTNSWISPNDERDWLLQSSATPISFTINLLYRVYALADDDGTREIGVWAWISIEGSRWQYPGQYEHRWCRMPTQRPTIDC